MTSKKPAQIYKLAFFKMGLLYLSTLFIVLSSIVVPGITQPKAYAQDYEGVFIDAVSVAVEGLGGDKKYASFVDDNPWGDGMGKGVNFQYTVAPSCNHEISGYDGGGSLKGDTDTLELDITVRKVNAAGQCITDHTGKVKLTEAKKAKITAYRLDNGTPDDRGDDIVFLPAYRVLTDNLPFTVQSALNGVFKRLPGDTVIEVDNCNVQTDCFVQFSGSRHDNIDTGGEWIQTVPPTHYYRRCATDAISQALVECEGRNVSLTFANNGDPISELPESYSGVDLATGGSDESGDAGAGGDSDDGQGTCEASGFSMAWIVCPVFNGLAELTDWIFRTLLDPFLTTPPVSTDPNSESFKVWSSFRVIGNIILVIGMLVIVFGQSLGGGLIDAYTAKKVFPRIIAAAILINLSVYFVAIAVDVSNILGKGIQQLMFAPFIATGASGFDLSGTQLAVMSTLLVGGGAGLIAGVAALGTAIFPLIGLFVVLPAVLIFIAILAVLILRQSLILFLVMISPIAFALYCLPNTEKYFKKWWEYLFKALLIYPIIAIMFALADIMAITVLAANGANSSNFLENGIAVIIAFIIQLVPLFVIPFSFKLAGGILGGLYGALNGFGKKSTEMVKGNANDQNSLRNRAKRGGNERLTRAQGKLIQPGRDVNASRRRKALSAVAGAGIFGNYDARSSAYNEAASKRADQLTAHGDDSLLYAGGGYKTTENGKTVYKDSKGRAITRSAYKRGKAQYGSSMHDTGQALGYALKKAQTDGDLGEFRKAFSANAQQQGWSQEEANGVWAAATYPHKGSFSSEWYSKPERQADGSMRYRDISNDSKSYSSFINDQHKTKQSFQLGSLRDGDWRAMLDQQQHLEEKLAVDSYDDIKDDKGVVTKTADQQRSEDATTLAQTYEVFDAASQKLQMVNPDKPGESGVAASGVSAAGAPIIQAAVRDRGMVGGVKDTVQFSEPGTDGRRTIQTPVRSHTVQTTGNVDRSQSQGGLTA